MKLGWLSFLFLALLLLVECDSANPNPNQKRKKERKPRPDVKKEIVELEVIPPVSITEPPPLSPVQPPRLPPPPPPAPEPEFTEPEEVESEFLDPITQPLGCPALLVPPSANEHQSTPCLCLDHGADGLSIECAAAINPEQLRHVFQTHLQKRRIEAVEIRNSTLPRLISEQFAGSEVTVLFLRHNELMTIEAGAFNGSEKTLTRLELNSNALRNFDFTTLEPFIELNTLNLGENKLTTISNAGKLPALRYLYLYANEIDYIAPKAFMGLESLEYLDLRWNRLQVLEPNSFQTLSTRWQLRLRDNQISTLEGTFGSGVVPFLVELVGNNISQLTEFYSNLVEAAFMEGSKLYLEGNPLQCDCTLSWLANNSTFVQFVDQARCEGKGTLLQDLDLEELSQCPPPSYRPPLFVQQQNEEEEQTEN